MTAPSEPGLPTRSFAQGVRHAPGTLSDVVNCAYLLGWKDIVLVGVDLYDSRYFWLEQDQTLDYDAEAGTLVPAEVNTIRGNQYDEPHNTAVSGVVEQMEVADIVWACELLSRLSDAQLDDAFEAAGYEPSVRKRFVTKVRAKIREGLDLRSKATGSAQ